MAAGIRPSFNIIFGFPGEGQKERHESIRFVMDICRRFPARNSGPISSLPIPAPPSWKSGVELGIEVPETLEGWVDFFPRYTILPWLNGRDHQELQTMRDYLRIAFDRVPIGLPIPAVLSGVWRRSLYRCPRAGGWIIMCTLSG